MVFSSRILCKYQLILSSKEDGNKLTEEYLSEFWSEKDGLDEKKETSFFAIWYIKPRLCFLLNN